MLEAIQRIYAMIESGESIEAFEKDYKILSDKVPFIAISILNEHFFRARKDDGGFIDHISKIKYPPSEYAKKGRLNDDGEVIAYLSLSELAPIVELDIGYYDIYCTAKIKYLKKDIIFHLVGVKKDKIEVNPGVDGAVFSLYRDLLTTKDKKVYNSTIALGRLILHSRLYDRFKTGKIYEMTNRPMGIMYSSVQEDKSNQNLFNIALKPNDFDECCKIVELTYSIMRYLPDQDAIISDTINKGKPLESGKIEWEFSYSEMIRRTNEKIEGEIFKIDNGIVHYKFGAGLIETETIDSYYVRFTKLDAVQEIKKDTVNNT